MTRLSAENLIPGGILPGDAWHYDRNDNTCSRCRLPVPDEEVPLMIFGKDDRYMLIYCEKCCGGTR